MSKTKSSAAESGQMNVLAAQRKERQTTWCDEDKRRTRYKKEKDTDPRDEPSERETLTCEKTRALPEPSVELAIMDQQAGPPSAQLAPSASLVDECRWLWGAFAIWPLAYPPRGDKESERWTQAIEEAGRDPTGWANVQATQRDVELMRDKVRAVRRLAASQRLTVHERLATLDVRAVVEESLRHTGAVDAARGVFVQLHGALEGLIDAAEGAASMVDRMENSASEGSTTDASANGAKQAPQIDPKVNDKISATILAAMKLLNRPASIAEIGDKAGYTSHHTVTPRLKLLRQAGRVLGGDTKADWRLP